MSLVLWWRSRSLCARRLARSASSERRLVRVLDGLGSGSAARARIWERRSWWRYRNDRSTPAVRATAETVISSPSVRSRSRASRTFAATAIAVVAPRGDQRVRGFGCHAWPSKFGSSAGELVVGRPRCTVRRVRRTIRTASSICRAVVVVERIEVVFDAADQLSQPGDLGVRGHRFGRGPSRRVRSRRGSVRGRAAAYRGSPATRAGRTGRSGSGRSPGIGTGTGRRRRRLARSTARCRSRTGPRPDRPPGVGVRFPATPAAWLHTCSPRPLNCTAARESTALRILSRGDRVVALSGGDRAMPHQLSQHVDRGAGVGVPLGVAVPVGVEEHRGLVELGAVRAAQRIQFVDPAAMRRGERCHRRSTGCRRGCGMRLGSSAGRPAACAGKRCPHMLFVFDDQLGGGVADREPASDAVVLEVGVDQRVLAVAVLVEAIPRQ